MSMIRGRPTRQRIANRHNPVVDARRSLGQAYVRIASPFFNLQQRHICLCALADDAGVERAADWATLSSDWLTNGTSMKRTPVRRPFDRRHDWWRLAAMFRSDEFCLIRSVQQAIEARCQGARTRRAKTSAGTETHAGMYKTGRKPDAPRLWGEPG
jgi:hypothetical protein